MPEPVDMVGLIMMLVVLSAAPIFIEQFLGVNNLAALFYPTLQHLHRVDIFSICVTGQRGLVKFHLDDMYGVTSLCFTLLSAEDRF